MLGGRGEEKAVGVVWLACGGVDAREGHLPGKRYSITWKVSWWNHSALHRGRRSVMSPSLW
jgi:hypothetical protein